MSIEEELIRARAAVEAAEAAVRTAQGKVNVSRRRLVFVQRRGTDEQIAAAERDLEQAQAEAAAARAALSDAVARVEELQRQLDDDQTGVLGNPPGDLPIVLLPVRLETRFQAASGDATDLLIRVYPDDLHIDTHEPGLTAEEIEWGKTYWSEAWRGGRSDAHERTAWSELADRFTPQRAAWIVAKLEPHNPDARPQDPVPDGTALPVAPRFPNVETKPFEQTRAPLAQLLPDRWIALGYGPSERIFTALGNPIREPLPVGPAPDPAEQPGDDANIIDGGMEWLIEFNEARAAGMGLRVRLPANNAQGFRRLLVFGVKNALAPAAAAERLAALIDAQHYTRGAECLSRDTPTNSTPARPSPFGALDSGHVRSFADERGAALIKDGDSSAGDRLASALGIAPSVFAHVHNAGDIDAVLQRQMATALWPVTVGYFLHDRLRGIVNDDELRAIRRHFIDYVRSGGPLGTMRFGRQPYGILPVTSIDRWIPQDERDVESRALEPLKRLREAWRRALVRVPRLEGTDLDTNLVAVLQLRAVSTDFVVRPVLGPEVVENLAALAGIDLNQQWWAIQRDAARVPLALSGLPTLTPQGTSVFSALTKPLHGPLATQSEYPALIADAGHQKIRTDDFPGAEARSVLDRLLRHGLLQEYSMAARRLAPRTTPEMPDESEPELVDIRTQPTATIWRRLAARLDGRDTTVGAFLDSPAGAQDPAGTDLVELRQALHGLAKAEGSVLEHSLREMLDLVSHRFDAWVTSLATRRLEAIRRTKPTGVLAGGYGWLEDLQAGEARASDGYLQGPSPDHAATAAILASGHLSHKAETPTAFAIDLSSKRVHQARYLLDGVRRGASPAGLLGYRIERRLHDMNLDPLILPFRKLAPLDIDNAERNVCHGVRLLELWRVRHSDPSFSSVVPPQSVEPVDRLFGEIENAVDAVSDLLLAEGVFQIGRGRGANAATTFDGIVRGEPLPATEVLDTPRHGQTFLYRLVAFADEPSSDDPWLTGKQRARAQAEPRLNAWFGRFFGDPARIRWQVRRTEEEPSRELSLADLGYAALDVACLGGAELLARAAVHTAKLEGAEAAFDPRRDAAWPPEIISLEEFAAFADAAREVISKAKGLTPPDLTLPEAEANGAVDIAEIRERADKAKADLEDTLAALRRARTNGQVEAAVERAEEFGVLITAPDGTLLPLLGIENQLKERAAGASGMTAGSAPEREVERLRRMFGGGFLPLPRFSAANGVELVGAWSASDELQGGDPHASAAWLARMACVKEGVARFADLARYADAFGTGDPSLAVAQFPLFDGDRWFALPFVAGQSLQGRRLSIVASGTVPRTPNSRLCGVILDEWTETVPAPSEVTGVAFHYDEPESRPPQALLLAVSPDLKRPWTVSSLEAVLLETLELAKLRLVDADAMTELDHYLPAAYVAANVANEAVATSL